MQEERQDDTDLTDLQDNNEEVQREGDNCLSWNRL